MSEVVAAGMMIMGVLEPLATKNIRLSIQKNRETAPQRGRARYLSSGWAGVWLGKLKKTKNNKKGALIPIQSSVQTD